MTHISSIGANQPKSATYNAVKIQVNNPQTNIAEGFKSNAEDSGIYNAVSIEVNNPRVEQRPKQHCLYEYKQADCPICAENAGFHPIKVPHLPVSYQATNFINNRTFINAELDVDKNHLKEPVQKAQSKSF